jgi:hypothetical protein
VIAAQEYGYLGVALAVAWSMGVPIPDETALNSLASFRSHGRLEGP